MTVGQAPANDDERHEMHKKVGRDESDGGLLHKLRSLFRRRGDEEADNEKADSIPPRAPK